MKTHFLFVLNPKSFWHQWKQEDVITKIHLYFNEINDKNYAIHISRFPRDVAGFIPAYAKELGDDTRLRVYAIGGDGILFDCLNGIMGLQNAELGAIPYGRTNIFLQGFGRNSKTAFRSIERQYSAPAVAMDVIHCGSSYSLSNCVIGLEAKTVRITDIMRENLNNGNAFTRWLNRNLYTLIYFIAGIAACRNTEFNNYRYTVDFDDKQISDTLMGISIFNSPYYGGRLHPVRKAMPNDGILDTLTHRRRGGVPAYYLIPLYVSGRYALFPKSLHYRQCRKIKIKSDKPAVMSMDGIVFYESDLEIELLPGAVRFIDPSALGYLGAGND